MGRNKRIYPFCKICIYCGGDFWVQNCDEYHKKKCCSRTCAIRFNSNKRRGVKRGPQKNPHGPKLTQEQRKGEIITCICGTQVWKPAAWLRKVSTSFCSHSCRAKHITAPILTANKFDRTGMKFPGTGLIGERNPAWRGGITYARAKGNYIGAKYVRCPTEFIAMARKDGYVMEHRLVIAHVIGRCLHKTEVVHHVDHNPRNNVLDNLELWPDNGSHKAWEHGRIIVGAACLIIPK